MISCEHFLFASPPRTGTAWFVHAVHYCGLRHETRANVHIPPPKGHSGPVVSIVRDPASWLASYYGAIRDGKIGVPVVDQFADVAKDCGTVREFMLTVARTMPGSVGEMFSMYRADTVLRLEDQPWATIEFLRMFKKSKAVDDIIRHQPPMNTRKQAEIIPRECIDAVHEAEEDFCDFYEYF